jgi:2-polyprenyl-3-methyl-5-hydroxy-6-metoxy-1,4-benzoquinol methylase
VVELTQRIADVRNPDRSRDPDEHAWSQWRSPALMRLGPGRIAAFVGETIGNSPQRVLEVGCGSGYLALELARAGHRVTALDPDADDVDIARRTAEVAREAGERFDLTHHVADFHAVERDGEPFDILVFNLSLHHIPDLPEVMRRTASLLAPGGRVVVNDFAYDLLDARTAAWLSDLEDLMALAGGREALEGTPADRRDEFLRRWDHRFGEHDLHRYEPLVTSLRESFRETHFSWHPYMFTRIANRAAAVPADRQEALCDYLYRLENLCIVEKAINALCYRFAGILK